MTQHYTKLIDKITYVKRRWRTKVLLKGLAITLVITAAAFYVSIAIGHAFNFSPTSIRLLRMFLFTAFVCPAVAYMLLPLVRRVSELQVARFIEERHPRLQERLVSAVEVGHADRPSPLHSAALTAKLIEDALENLTRVDLRALIQDRQLAAFGALCALVIFVVLSSILLGPPPLRFGASRLFSFSPASVAATISYKVLVTPGDAEVVKGSDQKITARFEGFVPDQVELLVRDAQSLDWTKVDMSSETSGNGFTATLANLDSNKEYYVSTSAVQSSHYRLTVADLPRITQLMTKYHFPAYTHQPPQTVEDDGNLSALKGTRVDVQAKVTQKVRAASILFNDGTAQPMTVEGETVRGRIDIQKNGGYAIQLTAENGRSYIVSSEYKIEAFDDNPPTVTITKPGRDRRATRIEEVFTEVKANDDIGVSKVELYYSVNGGEQKKVPLYDGQTNRKSVSAGHTLFLEELNVSPGDVVTYYAKAIDSKRPQANVGTSDLYFLEIQRSDKEYYQAQSMGGGQGNGNSLGQLTQRQKEIIAATWKLIRDKKTFPKKDYAESVRSVGLLQGRLKKEAEALSQDIQRRKEVFNDEQLEKLSEYFTQAAKEMGDAESLLSKDALQPAISPEQAALQQLLKAESLFREIRVAFSNNPRAGGERLLEDLEELFALEMDKLKNQYETLPEKQARNDREEQMDEALRRLQELARRQQKLNENNMRQSPSGAPSSGGGSGSQSMTAQQQIAKELEELKRQLERLAREKPDPQLNEMQGRLNRTLEQMRQSLEQMRQNNAQGAAGSGARALQQLNDLAQRMRAMQQGQMSDQIREARKEMERLVQDQKKIEKEVGDMAAAQRRDPKSSKGRVTQVNHQKEELAHGVEQAKDQIGKLARESRARQKNASEKLSEAQDALEKNRASEKIREGENLLSSGRYDDAEQGEKNITATLEKALKQLGAAERNLATSDEDRLADALNRTRELIDSFSSLAERLQQAQNRARADAKNQSGKQQGQTGPPGSSQSDAAQQSQTGRQGRQDPSQNGEQGQQGQQGSGQSGQMSQGQSQNGGAGQGQGQTTQPLNSEANGSLGGDSRPPMGGSGGVGPPGSEDPARQFQRELQERLREARDLAGRLPERDLAAMLEGSISAMRRLDPGRSNQTLPVVENLQKLVLDPLQRLELELSKRLERGIAKDKLLAMDEDSVPPEYRKLVQQYYKDLAEERRTKGERRGAKR